MIKISVILVTYNNADEINKCIDSLKFLKCEIEIIIVDNNSTDQTLESISHHKRIVIIKNNRNLGYSKAVNIGVKHATQNKILLLNPDTELFDQDYLALINKLFSIQNFGVASIKMQSNDKEAISVGYFPNLSKIFFLNSLLNKRSLHYKKITEVEWVQGSFMIFDKKVHDKIDGFNEDIFLYGEDLDYCYRLKKFNYQVLHDPNYSYYHTGGFSLKRTHYIYSGLLNFFKTYKPKQFLIAKNIILLSIWIRLFFISKENNLYNSLKIALESIKSEKNNI